MASIALRTSTKSEMDVTHLNKGLAMNRKLNLDEITIAPGVATLPAILTPDEAASLLRLKLSTLYRKVSEGCFGSAVKRGKPLRFWRDRLVQEFMR
jgi:excisionase family DNA binding protein